jgi:hypothetical protein
MILFSRTTQIWFVTVDLQAATWIPYTYTTQVHRTLKRMITQYYLAMCFASVCLPVCPMRTRPPLYPNKERDEVVLQTPRILRRIQLVLLWQHHGGSRAHGPGEAASRGVSAMLGQQIAGFGSAEETAVRIMCPPVVPSLVTVRGLLCSSPGVRWAE